MAVVNMHEAKSQLSKLVEAAMRGEDVVLARAGKAVARIVPMPPEHSRLSDDLGALGQGRSKEEVARIIAHLQEPWSEEELDDMLEGLSGDDEHPAVADSG